MFGSFLYDFYLLCTAATISTTTAKRYVVLLTVCGGLLMGVSVLLSLMPQNYGSVCFNGENRKSQPCEAYGLISIPFSRPDNPSMSTWTISARSLSLTYILFTCGWSYVVYCVCFAVSQFTTFESELLNDFSARCFLMYFAVSVIDGVRVQLFPTDSPGWMVPISLAVGCYLVQLSLNFFKYQNINVKF